MVDGQPLRPASGQVLGYVAASIAALFEPIGAMVIGLLLYGETLSLLGLVGSLLVLIAITLIARE